MVLSSLYRIFIPTWRFFDNPGAQPHLEWRGSQGDSNWASLAHAPRVQPWHIFLNPRGNLHHALSNAVARLLEESQTVAAEKVPELITYEIILRFVRAQVPSTCAKFEFRITACDSSGNRDEVLRSPEISR